jgi:hypothetical protein
MLVLRTSARRTYDNVRSDTLPTHYTGHQAPPQAIGSSTCRVPRMHEFDVMVKRVANQSQPQTGTTAGAATAQLKLYGSGDIAKPGYPGW